MNCAWNASKERFPSLPFNTVLPIGKPAPLAEFSKKSGKVLIYQCDFGKNERFPLRRV
ncbi:hypothetical protein EI77_02828 [Prosthecobacter fusiformis]|uniref:Uncharacterized protein n=1 Tax=Prosthecobacter fusiformis TaxID=48464 RepID=A0A4R7RY05_9BACT|nr:hypothetical protein EI77_02828 [Prosthecobacter fusiformis]